MAKFYGVIGYSTTKETAPGVWKDDITEREYFGELTRNSRRLQSTDKVNDDVNVANEISILALKNRQTRRWLRWKSTAEACGPEYPCHCGLSTSSL